MIKKLLYADPEYTAQLKSFRLRDTYTALGYYVLIMVIYWFMGKIMSDTGKYLGVPVNILIMLIAVLICLKDLSRTGLSRRNLRLSLIVAAAIGTAFLLAITVIPGIISHSKLLPLGRIAYNIFYYFVIIALSEEISFRGFIQPRLYPLVKNEWLTILIGGILFVFMHYPFQMAMRGMTFSQYWPQFIANAPMQLIWHLAFTELYRKYGNIFCSSVLHGFVDMSMGIFQ